MSADAVEIEVDGRKLRITHPERVYFSARGDTKLDLVNYYVECETAVVRHSHREDDALEHLLRDDARLDTDGGHHGLAERAERLQRGDVTARRALAGLRDDRQGPVVPRERRDRAGGVIHEYRLVA